MSRLAKDGAAELVGPLASLIAKSEKALQKLAPGSWQHTMLEGNLRALRLGRSLMTPERNRTTAFPREELEAALHAFAVMVKRSEVAQAKFASGTPQHSLQRNRLRAFRSAAALIRGRLSESTPRRRKAP